MFVPWHRYAQWMIFVREHGSIFVNKQLVNFWEVVGRIEIYFFKDRFVSIEVVRAWGANMHGFMWVWFWVFNCVRCDKRNWKNGNAARHENSVDLGDSFMVILDVFKNMRCVDDIVSAVLKREVAKIYFVVNPRHVEIGGFIATETTRKHWLEKMLGSEMQHFHEFCFNAKKDLFHYEMLQPVAFK